MRERNSKEEIVDNNIRHARDSLATLATSVENLIAGHDALLTRVAGAAGVSGLMRDGDGPRELGLLLEGVRGEHAEARAAVVMLREENERLRTEMTQLYKVSGEVQSALGMHDPGVPQNETLPQFAERVRKERDTLRDVAGGNKVMGLCTRSDFNVVEAQRDVARRECDEMRRQRDEALEKADTKDRSYENLLNRTFWALGIKPEDGPKTLETFVEKLLGLVRERNAWRDKRNDVLDAMDNAVEERDREWFEALKARNVPVGNALSALAVAGEIASTLEAHEDAVRNLLQERDDWRARFERRASMTAGAPAIVLPLAEHEAWRSKLGAVLPLHNCHDQLDALITGSVEHIHRLTIERNAARAAVESVKRVLEPKGPSASRKA